jgi:hypothetical protein
MPTREEALYPAPALDLVLAVEEKNLQTRTVLKRVAKNLNYRLELNHDELILADHVDTRVFFLGRDFRNLAENRFYR